MALACIECGYNVVAAVRGCSGVGFQDIWDPKCREWIVEVPVSVQWADMLDSEVELEKIPAVSQLGLYMAVQTVYTDHNTSGTIELYKGEIVDVARGIFSAIGNGYISVSLSGRSSDDMPFPQLPIEPISKDEYERLIREVHNRRISSSIADSLKKLDSETKLCASDPSERGGCECAGS